MSLDPRANLAAREAEQRQREKPPRLNPPWPWRPKRMELEFFGLEDDPPAPPKKP